MWEDLGKPTAREILELPPSKKPRRGMNAFPIVNSFPPDLPLERTPSTHLGPRAATVPNGRPSQSRARPPNQLQSLPAVPGPQPRIDPRVAVLRQYGPLWETETGGQNPRGKTEAVQGKNGATTASFRSHRSKDEAGPSNTNDIPIAGSSSDAQAGPSNTNAIRTVNRNAQAGPPNTATRTGASIRFASTASIQAVASSGPSQTPQPSSSSLPGADTTSQSTAALAPTTSMRKRKRDDTEDAPSTTDKDSPDPKKRRCFMNGSCGVM
jgi:hypothetical protein